MDELNPKKNPHLRPQLNPFSIFGGNDVVPDIFDEEQTSFSKPAPRAAKTVVPAAVPVMDAAFSLTPSGDKKKGKTAAAAAQPVAAAPSFLPPPQSGGPSALPPPPSLVPSSLPGAHEDDDSFFEDEPSLPSVLPSSGLEKRVAELELKVAQSNVEVMTAREQMRKMQLSLEQESASKRALEEEVRQLNIKLVNQKKKEAEDNKALEAALLAIEAKLQAANARAKDAESELAVLRAQQGGGGADGDDIAAVKKKLARAHRTAANLSLEFGEATQKSGNALREMMTTMSKLTALLASFEKVSLE